MRKRILYISLIALFVVVAVLYAQYSAANYDEQGGARTVVGGDLDVVDGGEINIEDGGDFYMEPTDDLPTAAEGWIYFDDSNNALTYHNGSAWVTLTTGTGDNTLDDAYDEATAGAGKKVTVDTGAIEFEVPLASDNPALHLDCDNTTNDPVALLIENEADAANAISIDIDAQATGWDIAGTADAWYFTGAGALTAVSGTIPTLTVATLLDATVGITLDNDETITNATDTEIKFAQDSGEDLIFDMDSTTNVVGLKSSTGVTGLAMGTVDDLSGIGTLAFDSAASTVTLVAASGSQDLTIAVTGANDSSLHLAAEGTGADAITIATSAGGMDITVAGSGDAEDLDIASARSLTLTSSEDTADAVKINASAGGIDIDAVGAAAQDIIITNTGGSILMEATENQANAFHFNASDAAGGITVAFGTNNMGLTGTGVGADFVLDCDVISLDGVGACNLTTIGGASEDITIYENCGNADASVHIKSNGNGADALTISTLTNGGGMDIIANGDSGDAGDLDITNTNGSVNILGGEAILTAVVLTSTNVAGGIDINAGTGGLTLDSTGVLSIDAADDMNFTITSGAGSEDMTIAQVGANDSSIIITAAGSGANAIELTTSNSTGDIDINAGDAITVDAGDVVFTTDDALADQFKVVAGGTIDDDAINLGTTDGGIVLTAGGAANGDVTVTAASVIAVGGSDDITITLTAGTAGEDLSLVTTGGADSSIVLTADGTEGNAIDINTTAGGIDIDMTGGVATEDFSITTATSIDFVSTEAVADQFKMNAQGTIDGDAINFETTDGGIMLNADGADYGDITLDAVDIINLISADTAANAIDIDSSGGIDIEAVGKVTLDITAATDGSGGFKVITNVPTGMQLYGSIYADTHLEGTTDGTVTGLRGKVSMDSASAPAAYVYGARITVEEVGADLSGASIAVLQLESILDAGGNDPAVSYMMRFNCSEAAETPTAWFAAANRNAIAYTDNAATGATKQGAIKITVVGLGDTYIWTYDSIGP